MTRVRFELETNDGGRLRVSTAYVDVPVGSIGRRLRLSVEGFVLLSVPLSPWAEYAGDVDDEDQADDEDPRHCGHESPDRGDAVFWTCEKPPGHEGWHAAAQGRMGWL